MIRAENVIPILDTMPEEELERLRSALGIVRATVDESPKTLISDGEATKIVLKSIRKPKRRRQLPTHN